MGLIKKDLNHPFLKKKEVHQTFSTKKGALNKLL